MMVVMQAPSRDVPCPLPLGDLLFPVFGLLCAVGIRDLQGRAAPTPQELRLSPLRAGIKGPAGGQGREARGQARVVRDR